MMANHQTNLIYHIRDCIDLAASLGLTLSVGSDFSQFIRFSDNQPLRHPVNPAFNPQHCDLGPANAFWLIGKSRDRELVLTQAIKLLPLGKKSLGRYMADDAWEFRTHGYNLDAERTEVCLTPEGADVPHQKAVRSKADRHQPVAGGIGKDHLRTLPASPDAAGNRAVADGMVAETAFGGHGQQPVTIETPDAQHLGQMRAIDIGNFGVTVAIEIACPHRGKPAVAAADGRRCSDQAGAAVVDGEPRAFPPVTLHHDDLRQPVAIHVGETRCDILEDMTVWQRRLGRAGYARIARAAYVDGQHLGVAQRPEHVVGVFVSQFGEPGDHFQSRGPRGPGFVSPGSCAVFEPRNCNSISQWLEAGLAGTCAGGQQKQRAGGDGPREAHQICFSGIWTTRPSSASLTRSWQVSLDRAGSGS